MQLVHECRVVGELSGAPWFFENPVSAISTIYRKPDYTFHPRFFGGYLPADDEHPLFPEYFPPRDAYEKRTCVWAGNGFVFPTPRKVPLAAGEGGGQGRSKAHNKLGGTSTKTKSIRSATPRGFSEAVFVANAPRGRCAKQTVRATLVTLDGRRIAATNHVGVPQEVCPRADMPTGEGYELCRTVCRQPGHAEINALRDAGDAARGATLYVEGHTYACSDCQAAAHSAGVQRVVVGAPPDLSFLE